MIIVFVFGLILEVFSIKVIVLFSSMIQFFQSFLLSSDFQPLPRSRRENSKYRQMFHEMLLLSLDKENIGDRDLQELVSNDKLIAPRYLYCLEFIVEYHRNQETNVIDEHRGIWFDISTAKDDSIISDPKPWLWLLHNNFVVRHPSDDGLYRINEILLL